MSSHTIGKDIMQHKLYYLPFLLYQTVPSIIATPNTACINADIYIYIYGLSVGMALLIIMIITVIISLIYIIKCHAKCESNILYIMTTMYNLFIYAISLISYIAKPTSGKHSHNICYHDYKEC